MPSAAVSGSFSLPVLLPALLAGWIGASFASFLGVCFGRWPREESVVQPRSRCDGCAAPIAWADNIPVASWLWLRGRCRHCAVRIPVHGWLAEVGATVAWAAWVAWAGWSVETLQVALTVTLWFAIAWYDARHRIIPDGLTVPLVLVAWGCAAYRAAMGDVTAWPELTAAAGNGADWVLGAGPVWVSAGGASLNGALLAAGGMTVLGWFASAALRREALGFGDITLMATVGAVLGPERSFLVVLLGSALALVAAVGARVIATRWPRQASTAEPHAEADPAVREGEGAELPFGTALAPSAVIILFVVPPSVTWSSLANALTVAFGG